MSPSRRRQARYLFEASSSLIQVRVTTAPLAQERDDHLTISRRRSTDQVEFFSFDSRRSLERAALAFPWDDLGRLALVTLTYPDEFPEDGKVVKHHAKLLWQRWKYTFGERPRGIWALEFQERGAPHYHVFMGVPAGVSFFDLESWGFDAWSDVVGFSDVDWDHHRRMKLRFNVAPYHRWPGQSAVAVAQYLWMHSGKWAQKIVPQGFENTGHFWGQLGNRGARREVEMCCEASYLTVRRVLARYVQGYLRRNPLALVRGIGGTYAKVPNADVVGARLYEWALATCPYC